MGARRWVPAGAAVLLVLGVLAARGGTAAAEEDLLPPVAEPEPSGAPSPELPVDGPLVLEANGLPGLRLGSARAESLMDLSDLSGLPDVDGDGRTTPADLPGGCEPVYGTAGAEDGTFSASGWVVEGVVSSVQVARWEPSTRVLTGVETWLGPTLGSPVEAVAELPGARTTTERPHGAGGPAVTVVHVPLDGVELVVSDASYQMGSSGEEARGRITTMEVRHPRARDCSQEALDALGPSVWGGPAPSGLDLTLGRDGVAAFPIGTPVQALDDAPGVSEELSIDTCQGYSTTSAEGGWVRLVALDGVVVQTQTYGRVATSLGVAHGGTAADVRAALPETLERYPEDLPENVEVVSGDRVVSVGLEPGVEWVPDVDVPVQGGEPFVQNIAVRAADVEPSRLC